ncbi:methyltransferase domain-containing protein [Sporolactobacillus shoreicorticis]|uniref:Class I SAM-dependent methyltransferase n=1 Tax=Sporolactobacillus shoreicorticis TaxID=1923877 RepID=A0ABW5RZZ7_9BACL|nr:class I SAM-dependent methyltransferase [Sporolactobacillus shoreicorticis]MCO7127203.1 methyltransferase domain-containing protein [Sporolactobacillus shoreicorticis]
MNNSDKFTGKASIYARFRPNYPQPMIDYLLTDTNPQFTVADIGSGTGILTRQLLDRGAKVIAVEPNEDMRTAAEKSLSAYAPFTSVPGSAEHTQLPDHCVDLITVAQAFHWFDATRFKKECRRILKPDQKVALIWNSRIPDAPLIKETEEICKTFCPNFRGFSGGSDNDRSIFCTFFRNGKYSVKTYSHPLQYMLDEFIGRHLSASYAPKPDNANHQPFVQALAQLFYRYEQNGAVSFPNETRCYYGCV